MIYNNNRSICYHKKTPYSSKDRKIEKAIKLAVGLKHITL